MKKKKIILLCVIILIFSILIGYLINRGNENMSIIFEEVDSFALDVRGYTWETSGERDWEQNEFPEIPIEKISTKEEAQNVGNEILERIQGVVPQGFELIIVRHDPQINFWRFVYFFSDLNMRGSAFHVAVDGNTGQILRMWWD